ncbi:hypothetical protein [Enterobacter sp. AM17-18]|uniref:hypothetical protein n=1 Tax=Enterobacter sp. AM17-18 TaxID=2293101 RepID=UPI000E418875|nr:hypothetical protein [Enterobacter sp. AM17-18]RGD11153.1 hypothetical protein DW197_18230 [Enterobacter sp. AM17-18]
MKLFEMEGFLRGKCLPGDMKVNETNAEYLVRKFAEAEAISAALAAEMSAVLTDRAVILEDLDNTCFEIGMQRGEKVDAYPTPTVANHDAFLAEVRAQAKADGVQEYADSFRHSASKIRECNGDTIHVRALLHHAKNADDFAAQLRKGVQS